MIFVLAESMPKTWAILHTERAGLATSRVTEIPPAVDWSRDVATINRTLRGLWHYVELGLDLQPVRAEWVVPGWRSED